MTTSPELSIVIPFFNEEDCLESVCLEIKQTLPDITDKKWELIMVDDGSNDRTPLLIDRLAAEHPEFRAIHLQDNSGQSAALDAGFREAQGKLIATLDGDGQNDPLDLKILLQEMSRLQVDMMCGIRERRADTTVRKWSSRIANRVRETILHDNISDVGCAIRIFRRDCLDRVSFFRNAHRFFPALFQMSGFRVAETPVNHRPRLEGNSKYGGGIQSRLWVGLIDLAGVYWLRKRALHYNVTDKAIVAESQTESSRNEHHIPDKQAWASDLWRLIAIGLVFLCLAILLRQQTGKNFQLQIQEYRQILQGVNLTGGVWSGRLLFLLLGGLAVSFGVPRLWVSGIAGAIYGTILGSGFALASSLIGATSVYIFGRTMLAEIAERRFGSRLNYWRRRFQDNAFWWVLYGRLFPFSNATLKSLLCGSCQVPFGAYISASFLGFLPLTLVFAAFGSGGALGNVFQVLLGFGLLFAAVFFRIFMNKKHLGFSYQPPPFTTG